MNVKTAMAVALVCGSTLLGGCASMHGKGDPSALKPDTGSPSHTTMDAAYVAAVDQQASDQGVQVIWINPPDKHHHD